jgi:hypothetical protein
MTCTVSPSATPEMPALCWPGSMNRVLAVTLTSIAVLAGVTVVLVEVSGDGSLVRVNSKLLAVTS